MTRDAPVEPLPQQVALDYVGDSAEDRSNFRGEARLKTKALVLVTGIAMLAGLAAVTGPATSGEPTPKCLDGKDATKVTVGIVQMLGCWTERTTDGTTVQVADLAQQPQYGEAVDRQIRALDMNGFLVSAARSGDKIIVNTKTNAIRSVNGANETASGIKLFSIGYPLPKNPLQLGGEPVTINLVPPNQGSVTLEDLQLGGSDAYTKSIAGFSPVGSIETPIILNEDGKGSMNLTITLGGIFTLKGKDKSATIKIPSAVGERSKIDGFSLHLKEIDGIKLLKINELEAEYSAEEKKLGGSADFTFPFMSGKGVSFAFEIQNTILTKASVGVSGVKVPIGAQPGGFSTAMNGSFGYKQVANYYVVNLTAGATAEFGPELPTPWGKVVPIEVNSSLLLGKEGQDWYFHFDGGVKVFRLGVGNVYLKIYTASGIDFGFGIGIGFPSYRNSPDDPFYIGDNVNGWVAKQRFQFAGSDKVRLFGLDIFDGQILINTKAAGACWKVLFADGGAVYEYGKSVQTFGVTCGLDRYREAYPSATRSGDVVASANQTRRLSTGKRAVILSVRGKDGAPRFSLSSKDGRKFAVPKNKDAVKTKTYMIVADEKHRITHVFTPRLRSGDWTLTPYGDSTPIMGAKIGQNLPPERVQAKIVGRGLNRTLIWNSEGNPHTRLAFTEVMKGGYEQPIMTTNKARGRFKFKATKGSHYGNRRLRAYVIHGDAPREVTVEDRFTVRKPGKLRAPGKVRAWRNVYTATASWQGVRGAHGYVAEIAVKKNGKKTSSYRRVVGPRKRKIVIPRHPGGDWAIASVQALNADGVPGRVRQVRFRLAPAKNLNLKQASRKSANSAVRTGKNRVRVRSICPLNGHCQTRVLLKVGGRTLAQASFQQVPGTFRFVNLDSKQLGPALDNKRNRLRVVVHQHRVGGERTALTAPVNGP